MGQAKAGKELQGVRDSTGQVLQHKAIQQPYSVLLPGYVLACLYSVEMLRPAGGIARRIKQKRRNRLTSTKH
jgi:hypothetical protein